MVASGKQYAALPLAVRNGEVQVMLVTSRETKRWVLPKGWAEPDLAPHELAAKEAFEEAGLIGPVETEPIGAYSYSKRLPGGRRVHCNVTVFPMWPEQQLKKWPERRHAQDTVVLPQPSRPGRRGGRSRDATPRFGNAVLMPRSMACREADVQLHGSKELTGCGPAAGRRPPSPIPTSYD